MKSRNEIQQALRSEEVTSDLSKEASFKEMNKYLKLYRVFKGWEEMEAQKEDFKKTALRHNLRMRLLECAKDSGELIKGIIPTLQGRPL